MSYPFSKIIIMYNPVSTGNSASNAKDLKKELKTRLRRTEINLIATEYAGHAEEIGKEYAKDSGVLLVSSSGDGGYNELINGVLSVENYSVSVCVLPSGNANDHARALESDDIAKKIIAGKTRKIDVLKITGTSKGKQWSRYAHSYIGAGLTAYIGKKLTAAELNPFSEKWLVLKYLVKFSHVSLSVKSWRHKRFYKYSSFVVANIDRMSKIIKLDENSSLTDGKFEVYAIRSRSLLGLLKVLLSASVSSQEPTERTAALELTSKNMLQVQCDGEVFTLDKAAKVSVTNEKQSLKVVG